MVRKTVELSAAWTAVSWVESMDDLLVDPKVEKMVVPMVVK